MKDNQDNYRNEVDELLTSKGIDPHVVGMVFGYMTLYKNQAINQTLQTLEERIAKNIKSAAGFYHHNYSLGKVDGYNQALDDLKAIIQELREENNG